MKSKRTSLIALALSIFATSAFSAGFLKIEGIEGEATDKDHKGWIDVLSVSGLSSSNRVREKGSGLPTGKRQHQPITITKRIDKSTPLLARSQSQSGFPSEITLSQNGKTYRLSGVSVQSVKRSGDTEQLTLTYSGMKMANGADYNSSRSNSSRAVAAPNHNTTRSNRTR